MTIFKWLFEKAPAGWLPQMCWAGQNKSALLWLPGATFKGPDYVRWAVGKAQFTGCTQLAFQHYTSPQYSQPCVVCFVALDIDDLPIDDSKLLEICEAYHGSLRASCGGSGRHLIFRLANPIGCSYEASNRLVKLLTAPIVKAVEAAGMSVCKADKRAFYLEGGMNRWIHKTEEFYENQGQTEIDRSTEQWIQQKVSEYTADPQGVIRIEQQDGRTVEFGVTAGIDHWLGQFRRAGLLNTVRSRNPVNISRYVKILRLAGESVHTRSPLTSTTGVNGYLDVGPDWISLWAWADGAPIWRWDE